MAKKRMGYILLTVAILYALLVAGMYHFQRSLLYFPDKNIAAPDMYGLTDFMDTRIMSTDQNTTLQVWYRRASEGFPTIVYYHGNASHIGNRAGILGALAARGFGVLALSYRGYGRSDGTPEEQGLYDDARAAIYFLTDGEQIPMSRLILFGESLGTGVAVQMASEHEVGGVLLQAAYTSVAARAAEIYFYIPVKLLIKDRFDSLAKVANIKAPMLFFHGELDETIPIRQGRKLYETATTPRDFITFTKTGHNDFDSEVISEHALAFAKKYHLVSQ